MLQRRDFLSRLVASAALVVASSAWAQRPTHPIVRRPGGAVLAGRFNSDGVASGALPGVYVVVGVDSKAEMLQLRDGAGRTAAVRVRDDLFDLDTLKPGDEVEVDFLVPQPGATQLEAGGLWKVQR